MSTEALSSSTELLPLLPQPPLTTKKTKTPSDFTTDIVSTTEEDGHKKDYGLSRDINKSLIM
ncbi:hypothetical protein ANCCAN_01933 [Ancylostoma caninum]|uniref:Uncharacterized protein n=1 Tax=Ancylostoma caninum TaxID=29170 RepID=A0A368H9B8_ANCCA|nr:hypothetical protein ANCCAN_01933 [Ancylostoma caninum]